MVDNGSVEPGTDEMLEDLEARLGDRLHIIRNKINHGFAGGVNTGIRFALEQGFDYVALFNNDAIAETNWLEKLVEASNMKRSAITTGLLLSSDGERIDSTGDWYSIWGLPFPRNRGDRRNKAPKSGFVFGASGGASLYRTSLFKNIGLFDEAFFAYYEDVDISFRAQLSGHKVFYTDKAVAYHIQGAATSGNPGFAIKQTFKNLPWLMIKNVPSGIIGSVAIRFIVAYHLMLAKALTSSNRLPALSGWGLGISRLPVVFLQRIKIQSQRRAATSYMRKLMWPDLPPDQTGLRKLFKKH